MNKNLYRYGFTLIEILVVISIISILTAVLYASFSDARILSKNKIMRSELKETQLALEVYKAQYDKYPVALTDLKPDFMANIPDDSKSANDSCVVTYAAFSSESYYKLTAEQCHGGASTAAEGVQSDDEMARCLSTCTDCAGSTYDASAESFYNSYAVYSNGGQCE